MHIHSLHDSPHMHDRQIQFGLKLVEHARARRCALAKKLMHAQWQTIDALGLRKKRQRERQCSRQSRRHSLIGSDKAILDF